MQHNFTNECPYNSMIVMHFNKISTYDNESSYSVCFTPGMPLS